ncbi:MAG: NAD(P)/FAD-dependent oxidoreductase [Bacteroidota bacterium]
MPLESPLYDVICIGGGLAGLTAALHLSVKGYNSLIIEKNAYPKHKVCGEYISNEVLPYLRSLGFDPIKLGAKEITDFELTTINNKQMSSKLPLGGFGMSRYAMDYELMTLAEVKGATIIQDAVVDVEYKNDQFTIKTKSNNVYNSRIVIGAFGKRSNLDVKFQRAFIKKKSPYLAVKLHVSGDYDDHKVALHNFKGGYCGVSKVESNAINLCYITSYKAFKSYKTIDNFQDEVLFKNDALKAIFKNSTPQFEKPLSISQISFQTKAPVEDHMLMCGDTAGMIHPLCGNGMAMAIRSAQMAAEQIIDYLQGVKTRAEMEQGYSSNWKQAFTSRLRTGHFIAYLFRQVWLAPIILRVLVLFPSMLSKLIKRTHGKPMKAL